RQKILEALLWLKANNRYYYDIEIDMDALGGYPESGSADNRPSVPVHFQRPDDTILEQAGSYTDHGVTDQPSSGYEESSDIPVLANGKH
ncbi:hypothetical protein K435DRAFT_649595, partial [Dendrothele bispora CBS 962.96]